MKAILAHFTPEEHASLKAIAAKSGLTLGAWVRQTLLKEVAHNDQKHTPQA